MEGSRSSTRDGGRSLISLDCETQPTAGSATGGSKAGPGSAASSPAPRSDSCAAGAVISSPRTVPRGYPASPKRRLPPGGARFPPVAAAPAPRRCSGRRRAGCCSQRSASSNRRRRSVMSASALSAITFSPSRAEHVRNARLGGGNVAQVQVTAAEHDAGGDVVGVERQARAEQVERPLHLAVLPVDFGERGEGQSLRVLGVSALELLDLAKCHPGPGFSRCESVVGGRRTASLWGVW